MTNSRSRPSCKTATLFALFVAVGALAGNAELEIVRSTIDGGGVMHSNGGDFALSGTIGQADAGAMTGGTFELTGGFWFALRPGDCDEDGTIGLADHAAFDVCLAGPGILVDSACNCFDLDQTGTVDLADFARTQSAHTAD